MRQHKFCLDKLQYSNAKLFTVHVIVIEVVENYHECFKCGT